MEYAMKKFINITLVPIIIISIGSIFLKTEKNQSNQRKKQLNESMVAEKYQDPIAKSNRPNKKINREEKNGKKPVNKFTILEKEVYLLQKSEFKLGKKIYKTSKESLYRVLKKDNKERLITNKVFFSKRDLGVLRTIFPNNKIEIRPNYILMEIKFNEIEEIYNTLKNENIKFNHEFLRPSPTLL